MSFQDSCFIKNQSRPLISELREQKTAFGAFNVAVFKDHMINLPIFNAHIKVLVQLVVRRSASHDIEVQSFFINNIV